MQVTIENYTKLVYNLFVFVVKYTNNLWLLIVAVLCYNMVYKAEKRADYGN